MVVDPLWEFRLNRLSRMHRFYDPEDGDWAWQDIRGVGREIQVFPIPKRPQTWVVSMFAVGKETGLGLLEEKIQVRKAECWWKESHWRMTAGKVIPKGDNRRITNVLYCPLPSSSVSSTPFFNKQPSPLIH